MNDELVSVKRLIGKLLSLGTESNTNDIKIIDEVKEEGCHEKKSNILNFEDYKK